MKTLLTIALSCALFAGCTTFSRPFADPADASVTQKIMEGLAPNYSHITATAVGGRVYLDGTILNHQERMAIFAIVEKVPGVTHIVDGMRAQAELGGGID